MSGCVYCDRARLDGHLTCGRASCSEAHAREDNEAFWLAAHLGATSTVYLRDGRAIDVTGLSFDEAVTKLRQRGIDLDAIRETRHSLPRGLIS
jgi:hypothetical protein